jgi:hypothetical protein
MADRGPKTRAQDEIKMSHMKYRWRTAALTMYAMFALLPRRIILSGIHPTANVGGVDSGHDPS